MENKEENISQQSNNPLPPPVNNVPPVPSQPSMQVPNITMANTSSHNTSLKIIIGIVIFLLLAICAFVAIAFFTSDKKKMDGQEASISTGLVDNTSMTNLNEEKNITPTPVSATATVNSDNIKCDNEYDAVIEKHGR